MEERAALRPDLFGNGGEDGKRKCTNHGTAAPAGTARGSARRACGHVGGRLYRDGVADCWRPQLGHGRLVRRRRGRQPVRPRQPGHPAGLRAGRHRGTVFDLYCGQDEPAPALTRLRIGLISDTHGLLRPEALDFLAGADHIVHGGDIGGPDILERLGTLAPLTVVRGNNDTAAWARAIPETARLELG
ncbi:MAG: metallophosphoesterase, partial [Oxalobacteraceae bacterium]